jgi:hypothetical protein
LYDPFPFVVGDADPMRADDFRFLRGKSRAKSPSKRH